MSPNGDEKKAKVEGVHLDNLDVPLEVITEAQKGQEYEPMRTGGSEAIDPATLPSAAISDIPQSLGIIEVEFAMGGKRHVFTVQDPVTVQWEKAILRSGGQMNDLTGFMLLRECLKTANGAPADAAYWATTHATYTAVQQRHFMGKVNERLQALGK